jgi:hypothetical protein
MLDMRRITMKGNLNVALEEQGPRSDEEEIPKSATLKVVPSGAGWVFKQLLTKLETFWGHLQQQGKAPAKVDFSMNFRGPDEDPGEIVISVAWEDLSRRENRRIHAALKVCMEERGFLNEAKIVLHGLCWADTYLVRDSGPVTTSCVAYRLFQK